jgi:predicted nucleic acid-binding protein
VIVIADTSVVSNLAIIGRATLLPQIYGEVVVPDAVWEELKTGSEDHPVVSGVLFEEWLQRRSVQHHDAVDDLMRELDEGEAEAIVLAQELRADLLLLDERQGRRVAQRLGLNFTGILGVLLQAKAQGLIPAVSTCLEDLRFKARFWIHQSVIEDCLLKAGEQP